MGVWIETVLLLSPLSAEVVTPCMGVWIETNIVFKHFAKVHVTPCMGVWIETLYSAQLSRA